MIILRDFSESDIPALSEIHKRQPELGVPSLNNIIINKTIEQDGKIIGYGVIKQFAEAILILDNSIRTRDKAETMKQVMRVAIHGSDMLGLEQLYITTDHEGWAKTLQNSYGFIQCPSPYLLLNLR